MRLGDRGLVDLRSRAQAVCIIRGMCYESPNRRLSLYALLCLSSPNVRPALNDQTVHVPHRSIYCTYPNALCSEGLSSRAVRLFQLGAVGCSRDRIQLPEVVQVNEEIITSLSSSYVCYICD
jgi:hypothetical protein